MQEAQRRAIKLGMPIQVHSLEALLQMLYLSYGHAAWLKSEIEATDDLGTFESRVLVNIYNDERDRCARVAKACLDANIEERQVRLAERWGEQMARLIRGILTDLALTPAQRKREQEVVRKHLLALDSGAEPDTQPETIEGKAKRVKRRKARWSAA